jgi:subtilisin family serine protease
MSFAGPRVPLLAEEIKAAYKKGVAFVAAAGNNGPDAPPAYPAAYKHVIAITATDEADHLYTKANRGNYVVVAAPGVDILVPVANEGFDYFSGTSFAAAHITGIVALLQQRDPDLTPEEILAILKNTAHSLPNKNQAGEAGVGIADAFASLQKVEAFVKEK